MRDILIIGIAGGTGSGKSTLTERLKKRFGDEVTVIRHDDYYKEQVLKKRLAYSSVSQISYVLTGLFFMTAQSVQGGLLHVVFHACIKICLFLVAGSLIFNTGKHSVEEYHGMGKAMPKTMIGFTMASLALVGIPPFNGFVSKWYLALGALRAELPVFSWLGPVVLLISALLTAGYLLPITIHGFFPGPKESLPEKNNEGGPLMWVTISVLALLTLCSGLFARPLAQAFGAMAEALF